MTDTEHQPRFAHDFYCGVEWRKCRAAFLRKNPLCERCGMPAEQVHHIIKLTPENIKDPAIALSFDNLEALCANCHREEHKPEVRWRTDAMGHVEL